MERRSSAYYRAAAARARRLLAEATRGPVSVRDEIQRYPINAVAQMARWRAIVKDVPKMAAAVRAMNLGSDHAKGSISGGLNSPLDRIIEAGPAGSAFELSF